MNEQPLSQQLLDLIDEAAQQALLIAHHHIIDDALIDALKLAADQEVRADVQRSLAIARLIYRAAALSGDPFHRALGLFAEANAYAIGGLGDYERAIARCDEAAAIYAHAGHVVDQADAQVTKIYALTMLGRYTEALTVGEWAVAILEKHQEWLRLATVVMNLAVVYGRMGQDQQALTHLERAGALYRMSGNAGEWSLPGVEMNQAIVLRNLGRLDESLAANTAAIEQLEQLGQQAEIGHAQLTMAFTHYLFGRYTAALHLLQQARACFVRYERPADLLITDLYRCHCLLAMRRFADVIEQSQDLAATATHLQQPLEAGQAYYYKALAALGLTQDDQARAALTTARTLFHSAGHPVWAAECDLEQARLLRKQGQTRAAMQIVDHVIETLHAHGLPIQTALAQVERCHTSLAQDDLVTATAQLQSVLAAAEQNPLPLLRYRAHALAACIATATGNFPAALTAYDSTLAALDQLRDEVMVEYRPTFLEDKQRLYAAALRLALQGQQTALAFQYSERARARGLHDLLTHRLDLRLQVHNPADQPLVNQLMTQQQAVDQQYRRLREQQGFAPTPTSLLDDQGLAAQTAIHTVEAQITTLWHDLLIRNSAYLRQATNWRDAAAVSTPAALQPLLPVDSALLAYFVAENAIYLFLITTNSTDVYQLSTMVTQVQRLLDVWQLNSKIVAANPLAVSQPLLRQAETVLHQLYQALLEPVKNQLDGISQLIFCPHDLLHYVPFAALVTQFDRQAPNATRYLLDRYTISYLPSPSLLPLFAPSQHGDERGKAHGPWNVVSFGHSLQNQLPHAVAEAQEIAALFAGTAFLEETATKASVAAWAQNADLLHFATHGEFRADNPLFSGLALADGQLTTLDIFNLRTQASLVTLSACQTGRNVIGGGDELLGLMRAFLAAGASALVLTLWAVHDESTGMLMATFYRALLAGESKDEALRSAQHTLRAHCVNNSFPYAHPYFWAPFQLIGDCAPL